MDGYTVVREERPGANLPGREPYVLARSLDLDATVLERRSDGRLFLLLGATSCETQARYWVDSLSEGVD